MTAATPTRALYIFSAFSLVGSIVYGLYYGVFLYKNTFSLSVLALDGLLGGLGCWVGYLLGVMIVRRYGYGWCIRLAFGGWAVVSVITALLVGHIAEWFMLLAVIKALPAGLYGATTDTMMLREVANKARNSFLQVKLALEFLATVILPTLIGALLHFSGGYQLAFLLAGVVYAMALVVPLRLARPELHFNVRETLSIFNRPLYRRHAANRMMGAGFNQLNGFVIMIIPFLLLQDELKLGLLTSGIALVAGIVSLVMRKVKSNRKMRLGYASYTVRALAGLMFVSVWTAPVLMVWQLINKLATPLHDPLQQGLDIHNDRLIMGEDVKAKALNINVLNNTLLLVGSTVAYGAFYLITRLGANDQRALLQVLIMSFAVWRFVNLAISASINREAVRRSSGALPSDLVRVPLWQLMRSRANSRLTTLRYAFARA
jgi:hypothetical protein